MICVVLYQRLNDNTYISYKIIIRLVYVSRGDYALIKGLMLYNIVLDIRSLTTMICVVIVMDPGDGIISYHITLDGSRIHLQLSILVLNH